MNAYATTFRDLGRALAKASGVEAMAAIMRPRAAFAVAADTKHGARLMIANRWRIARALPPDLRFNEPLAAQLAWVNQRLAAERVRHINGMAFDRPGDTFDLMALRQLRLALRYLRRFPGAV